MSAPDSRDEGWDEATDLAIALTAATRFQPESLFRLLKHRAVWLDRSPTAAVARRVGVRPAALREASALAGQAAQLAAIERDRVARAGARLLLVFDDGYPSALRDLEQPPFVLYCRGRIPSRPAVSIVGPRSPDPWALEATRLFAQRFSEAGMVVVSGFARGVDRAAHESALRVSGGLSVAVLGCGLDVDYPRGQRRLHESIASSGAMVSEFPLDVEPRPHFFPVRNRLIAALGWGTLVIQAAARSGSLITARLALDLGREVMALPGRIFDRRSRGSNLLIRDGARCVLDPAEVLDTLPLRVRDALGETPKPVATPLRLPTGRVDEAGVKLLRALEATSDPWSAEQAAQRLGLPLAKVLAVLAELEIDGRVRRLPGARYLVITNSLSAARAEPAERSQLS